MHVAFIDGAFRQGLSYPDYVILKPDKVRLRDEFSLMIAH